MLTGGSEIVMKPSGKNVQFVWQQWNAVSEIQDSSPSSGRDCPLVVTNIFTPILFF